MIHQVHTNNQGLVLHIEPCEQQAGLSMYGELVDVEFVPRAPTETVEPTGNSV